MKTLVVLHVTLVLSKVVVKLGPVRVMGAGVVVRPHVAEVSCVLCACLWLFYNDNFNSFTSVMLVTIKYVNSKTELWRSISIAI